MRYGNIAKPKYLDSQIYKRRLAAVLAPWLIDSNRRATEAGTTAFCCATGLGLGAWGVDSRQRKLMHEVYAELLTTLPLPAVSDLVTTEPRGLGVVDGEWLADARTGNAVRIRPAKANGNWRSPASKLRGADAGKLLCPMYAWDAGAYPGALLLLTTHGRRHTRARGGLLWWWGAETGRGRFGRGEWREVRHLLTVSSRVVWVVVMAAAGNEFYEPYGMLSGSGDPAAACCSTITELGNPEINTVTRHFIHTNLESQSFAPQSHLNRDRLFDSRVRRWQLAWQLFYSYR